jgi:S-adenosylmethionine:tRNA ribosyltransferase-isomerase
VTTYLDSGPRTLFELPPGLAASTPPEARGLGRDEVRLLVARPAGMRHSIFHDLGESLSPGDLLVVNTSLTRPAAVDGVRAHRRPVVVHFSTLRDDGTWVVEFRAHKGRPPMSDVEPGEIIELPDGMRLKVLDAHPGPRPEGSRLWRVRPGGPIEPFLAANGRPIAYDYVHGRWPLSAYQTVFGREGASAEMPSAARPFSQRLVTELVARGVNFAPIVLHCGVSSLEAGEPPQDERFRVAPASAWLVNQTRAAGGRVIAVGTTAARALETVARDDGSVSAGEGWTDLVLGPGRPTRTIDGLITGWHQPGASHLSLLEAVAGPDLVQRAYDTAIAAGYLWHEFGDSCLFLPDRRGRGLGTAASSLRGLRQGSHPVAGVPCEPHLPASAEQLESQSHNRLIDPGGTRESVDTKLDFA